MMSLRPNLFNKILTFVIAAGLLTACAPPPTTPASRISLLETRQLLASLDKQAQTLQTLSQQVADLESRLQRQDAEINQIRQGPQAAQTGYGYQHPQPEVAGSETASAQTDGSPTEVYLQAFGDYASGRYPRAIQGFESFLQRFPNNSYASNAQFWLGDCYFNQQQYPLAIKEFERVSNNYQSAPKAPDSLLKIAIAQLRLGATEKARQAINTLSQRYPKSTATQKAQELSIP